METDPWGAQLAARAARATVVAAVAEDVQAQDRDLLSRLTPERLVEQYQARWLVYQHLRAIWDTARTDGLKSAVDPAWS